MSKNHNWPYITIFISSLLFLIAYWYMIKINDKQLMSKSSKDIFKLASYTFQTFLKDGVHHVKFSNHSNNTSLKFKSALHLLKNKDEFRELVIKSIAESPFESFYWECPPVTSESADSRDFEFVTINAPLLHGIKPEPKPFEKYIKSNGGKIAVFENLGKDAVLIAPGIKDTNLDIYAHFSTFIRSTQKEQIDNLFESIGDTMLKTLEDYKTSPIWLSTCGTGVSWLHIRLDTYPKYYSYMPFKTEKIL